MNDIQKFAKAFELWENGYRADPSKFLTEAETATMEVSTVSIERAEYFNQLLKEITE